MSLLYSHRPLLNNFEGCAIGKLIDSQCTLACFSKNILKFYLFKDDTNLLFLFDEYLLENMIQIETYKYNEEVDGLIILFESSKMCTVIYKNNTAIIENLRCFENTEYDINPQDTKFFRFGEFFGITKISRRYFCLFSNYDFNARVFQFCEINEKIKNVIDISFLPDYIEPTICIVYIPYIKPYIRMTEYSAIICSYDKQTDTFYCLDIFSVPLYTRRILVSGSTMLFIGDTDILIKKTGKFINFPLNKMSLFSTENTPEIVLKNEKCYFSETILFIFNGNGYAYNIYIPENIINAEEIEFKFDCLFVVPRFIYTKSNYLFVGSNDCSFLFKTQNISIEHKLTEECDFAKKKKINQNEKLNKINKVYEEIYGQTAYESTRLSIEFIKIAEFPGIGFINDFCILDTNNILTVSEGSLNNIIEIKRNINFNICKKYKCQKFDKFHVVKDTVIIGNQVQNLKDQNTQYLQFPFFENSDSTINIFEEEDLIFQIMSSNIRIYEDGRFSRDENLAFTVHSAMYVVTSNEILIFMMSTDQNLIVKAYYDNISVCYNNVICFTVSKMYLIYYTTSGLHFVNLMTNEQFCNINNVAYFPLTCDLCNSDNLIETFKVLEILACNINNCEILCIINESGEFVIYKIEDKRLRKLKLDFVIHFNTTQQSKKMSQVKSLIYLTSDSPCFLYIDDKYEIFCYKSDYKIQEIVPFDKKRIIFKTQENVYVAEYPEFCKETKNKISTTFKNFIPKDQIIYSKNIFKKIPVKNTPKNLVIFKNYILVASSEKTLFKPNDEESGSVEIYTNKYKIDLYNKSYKYLSSYFLENDEYVFDIRKLTLNDTLGLNGKSDFIVLCITKIEGEDKHSRGRLVVLELIDIITDKDNLHNDKKLKEIGVENIKGCIIRCDELKGNIVVCLGIKTMVYKVDRSDGLIPIGIHDLHTLTTSLVTIKNYLLTCDIYRGLSFFYYQKRPTRLNLICTSEPINLASHVDFLVRDKSLYMLCFDSCGNMHVYTYSPLNILSCEGTKFVKRCQSKFNPGRLVLKNSATKLAVNPICISDLNFEIALAVPTEKEYNELLQIQNEFMKFESNFYGLNSEDFCSTDMHLKPLSLRKIISKEILLLFYNLPRNLQEEILGSDFNSLMKVLIKCLS